MDIFYPSTASSQPKTPILFYEYGGGLTKGDRTLPDASSLTYANVAAFFVRHGFITIIADYRLVPHVTFPGPSEDIRDAMNWIVANPEHLLSPQTPHPDLESIFLLGHSAGALHVSTMLLLPGFLPNALSNRIKGAVLVSGPYALQSHGTKDELGDVFDKYYGDREKSMSNSSQGLLESASAAVIEALPPLLLFEAERDPPFLQIVGQDFYDTLTTKPTVKTARSFAQGHNHISMIWALSSGEGEEWGEQTADWMKALLI